MPDWATPQGMGWGWLGAQPGWPLGVEQDAQPLAGLGEHAGGGVVELGSGGQGESPPQ